MNFREYITEKKTFPKEFKVFVDIVTKAKNIDDAYKQIIKMNNVPFEIADMFFKMYPAPDPKTALTKFYNDVRGSK
jgi:hypothetical protein